MTSLNDKPKVCVVRRRQAELPLPTFVNRSKIFHSQHVLNECSELRNKSKKTNSIR